METIKTAIPVSQIMTSDLHIVTPENSISDVIDLFDMFSIRHAPVVVGDKLIGIISKTDIQRLSLGTRFEEHEDLDRDFAELLSVEQVMKSDPLTISPNNTIRDVAKILTEHEFHALPVVKDEKLVGIVTTSDIIRLLMDDE